MNVIVCIKQVPSGSLPLDDTGILDRSRGSSQLNPGDFSALEAGLQIGEQTGGRVTAVTMGPKSAEAALRTAYGLGADRGILLCDPAFAGADVYATAYTLSQGISGIKDWDVILCGQQSTDGDTAQLPFSLARQLNIPALGWVKKLEVNNDGLQVSQELSDGTQTVKISGPCLLAVGKEAVQVRSPSLRCQLQARSREIMTMGLADLKDRDPGHYGQAGSCTQVIQVKNITKKRKNTPQVLSGPEGAARLIRLCREVTDHG